MDFYSALIGKSLSGGGSTPEPGESYIAEYTSENYSYYEGRELSTEDAVFFNENTKPIVYFHFNSEGTASSSADRTIILTRYTGDGLDGYIGWLTEGSYLDINLVMVVITLTGSGGYFYIRSVG